jgi:branched-chain amino acid transport system permease protein
MDTTTWLVQVGLNALSLSFIYITVALGFALVYGAMDVLNFAHGEIYVLAACLAYVFVVNLGVPFFLSMVICMLLVTPVGYFLERVVFRPLRGSFIRTLICIVGFMLVVQFANLHLFGPEVRTMGISTGALSILGGSITFGRLQVILVGGVAVAALYLFLERTKHGQAIYAIDQDSLAASLQGVDVNRMRSLVVMVGCSLAALAGVLVGLVYTFDPGVGLDVLLRSFTVVLIGGLGSIPGAILAGFLVAFFESYMGALTSGPFSMMLTFVLLVVVLLIRPAGLLGRSKEDFR